GAETDGREAEQDQHRASGGGTLEISLPQTDDVNAKIEQAGLDTLEYNARFGRYKLRLQANDVKNKACVNSCGWPTKGERRDEPLQSFCLEHACAVSYCLGPGDCARPRRLRGRQRFDRQVRRGGPRGSGKAEGVRWWRGRALLP